MLLCTLVLLADATPRAASLFSSFILHIYKTSMHHRILFICGDLKVPSTLYACIFGFEGEIFG
jgi:hypothetical protein